MSNKFTYRAYDHRGVVSEGIVVAHTLDQARSQLQDQQLQPIRLEESAKRKTNSLLSFGTKIPHEQTILFTRMLATMYRSGVPLLRGLLIIRVGKSDGPFNNAIDDMRVGLQSGKSLSETMADHPEIFDPVYISTVAAGEETGKLDASLDELAVMVEEEMELNRQVKGALRYPMMVMIAIALAGAVLLGFVVPRFVTFFSAFQADLPLPTKILMWTGQAVANYWYYMIAGGIALFFGLRAYVRTDSGGRQLDRLILNLPIVGELVVKANIARFMLLFRILFRAGLPMVQCLNKLAGTITNKVLSDEIRQIEELVRRGREADLTTEPFAYFPRQALHMMAIGLESGNLDSTVEEVGRYYTTEVRYRSRQLTAVIEPILTVVIGVMVLTLALAIFMPMWNLIKVIGK